jgi:hypothetical protein
LHTLQAHRFFEQAIGTTKIAPAEVTTDQAPVYPAVLEDLLPAAWHHTDRYANNRVECDHGRLKARLGPMRGLKQDRSARVIIAGQAFVQHLRRGHFELAVEEPTNRRVAVHSTNWSWRSDPRRLAFSLPWVGATQQRRLWRRELGLLTDCWQVSTQTSQHHPRPASREHTHLRCIALLKQLRVERRASGEASSVMATTGLRVSRDVDVGVT